MNQSANSPGPRLLSFDRVTVERRGNRLIEDVSLEIPQGRHTAILGPNGSGKSTLLRLLSRELYPSVVLDRDATSMADPQRGTIEILGRSDWHVNDLRRQMGIVTAALDHQFSFGQTGRMNLTQTVASGFNGCRLPAFVPPLSSEMKSAVANSIQAVRMERFANDPNLRERTLETFSSGERRRALIARALVHNPRILVLDEPSNGLDIAVESQFTHMLNRLASNTKITLLLVTHNIADISPPVGWVVLMKNGRVAAEGETHTMITSDRLSDLFDLPVTVHRSSGGHFSIRRS